MATIPHEAPLARRPVSSWWAVREMWAALAIVAMWVTVTVDAVFGPDIVATSSPTNSVTIPSAVAIAILATIGTALVAKQGLHDPADAHD
jgi:hypothetical protein